LDNFKSFSLYWQKLVGYIPELVLVCGIEINCRYTVCHVKEIWLLKKKFRQKALSSIYLVLFLYNHVSYQEKEGTDLFIIDEVGKMELFSPTFFPGVMRILESNIPILASIPIPKFGRDIPAGAAPFIIFNFLNWLE
jgi:NTPase